MLLVPTTRPRTSPPTRSASPTRWKIGRRDVGDGVLIVVAKNDRQVRIEVAKALEGAVPDLAARQIIDRDDHAGLRADDYAGGLERRRSTA